MNLIEHPSAAVFFAGWLVYVVIRGRYQERTQGQRKTLRRLAPAETPVLALVGVGTLLLPLLYLFSPWLAFADAQLPAALTWLGAPVLASGLWLFWRSHADLGLNWSVVPELREGHELVRHGVYRRIRHPMYAAILLVSLSQGLLLSNWLAGWSALASFGLLYALRVGREEAMMREAFGEQYRAYEQESGRLWPRWGR